MCVCLICLFVYFFIHIDLFPLFQTGNKKEAEKLVKNIIKIVVKINILYRNDQFSADDLKVANQVT